MNFISVQTNSKYLSQIKEIYENSFPDVERIPFDDMFNDTIINAELLGIMRDNKLVGFCFISLYKNLVYLIYLAISQELRNKGLGTKALKYLKNKYKQKTLILCCEKPLQADDMRMHRIEFYKRNGFKIADFQFDCFSETYLSLYNGKYFKDEFLELLDYNFPTSNNFKSI